MGEILSGLSNDCADAVQKAGASVVRGEARDRLPASGIIWPEHDLVVTAHHVVERDENIKVGLPGGESAEGPAGRVGVAGGIVGPLPCLCREGGALREVRSEWAGSLPKRIERAAIAAPGIRGGESDPAP